MQTPDFNGLTKLFLENRKYVLCGNDALGEGEFGRTYKISWNNGSKYGAMKVVALADRASLRYASESLRTSIQSEVTRIFIVLRLAFNGRPQITTVLAHPDYNNYVCLFDYKLTSKALFQVTMLCGGGSLQSFINHTLTEGPEEAAIGYSLMKMVGIVRFFHENNLLYRNMKPENFVYTQDHAYMYGVDFGLMKDATCSKVLTIYSQVGFRFLGPEITSGTAKYSRASDIWSLGMILLEMCVGRSELELQLLITPTATDLRKVLDRTHYDKDLKEAVLSCLSIDPESRPSIAAVSELNFLKRKFNYASSFVVPIKPAAKGSDASGGLKSTVTLNVIPRKRSLFACCETGASRTAAAGGSRGVRRLDERVKVQSIQVPVGSPGPRQSGGSGNILTLQSSSAIPPPPTLSLDQTDRFSDLGAHRDILGEVLQSKRDNAIMYSETRVYQEFKKCVAKKDEFALGNASRGTGLDLSGRSQKFWQCFCQCMKLLSHIRVFDLTNGRIGPDFMPQIFDNLMHVPNLKELHVSGNKMGMAGCQRLGSHCKYVAFLEVLNLSNNDMGDEGFSALADSFKFLPHLKTLDLSFNGIGDQGFSSFCANLEFVIQLEVINLWSTSRHLATPPADNRISTQSAQGLKKVVAHLSQLKKLNISKNGGLSEVGPILSKLHRDVTFIV